MSAIYSILSVVFIILGVVCWLIILIDAFKDAVWKGIVGLLCGLYLLYYALVEFDHEKKWLIVAGALLCSVIAGGLQMAAATSILQSTP